MSDEFADLAATVEPAPKADPKRHDHPDGTSCEIVRHRINHAEGYRINEVIFKGEVTVPACVANLLAKMENLEAQAERGIYEDRGNERFLGNI